MPTKKCSMCGIEKDIEDFHRGNGKLGRRSCCKICGKAYETDEKHLKRNEARRLRRSDPVYRKIESEKETARNRKNTEKVLYRCAKQRAKRKNMEFTITLKDIVIPEYCPLLGLKLGINYGKAKNNSISLDRIDNTKGYTPENIHIVSYRANSLKKDASLEELETLVKNLRSLN